MGITKSALLIVVAALIVMNVAICALVVMGFSVKRIEYAIFYRPYVEAETNALRIEIEETRRACFRPQSALMMKKNTLLRGARENNTNRQTGN